MVMWLNLKKCKCSQAYNYIRIFFTWFNILTSIYITLCIDFVPFKRSDFEWISKYWKSMILKKECMAMFWTSKKSGTCSSKLPVITGPVKLFCFPLQMGVSIGQKKLYSKQVKLLAKETEWALLEVRTHPTFLEILISKSDTGPVKLPGFSRNRPLDLMKNRIFFGACAVYITSCDISGSITSNKAHKKRRKCFLFLLHLFLSSSSSLFLLVLYYSHLKCNQSWKSPSNLYVLFLIV